MKERNRAPSYAERSSHMHILVLIAMVAIFTPGSCLFADVLINEVLYDPAAGLPGDANGDGTRDASEDEFVELANPGPGAVDIGGWQVGDDDTGSRYTFPGGTTIAVNEFVVVFGGGTPTGFPPEGKVYTDDGTIGNGLSNTGDNVWVITDDPSPETLEVYFGGASQMVTGGVQISTDTDPDMSMTRSPDAGGTWDNHFDADIVDNSLFSPLTTITGDETLPVQLSYFGSKSSAEGITVIWKVESELDLSHYELYKGTVENETDGGLIYYKDGPAGGISTIRTRYEYIDYDVEFDVTYYYTLAAVSLDGSIQWFGPIQCTFLQEDPGGTPPVTKMSIELDQNFPNPFNPRTTINFYLPEASPVTLNIYDIAGRLVNNLHDSTLSAGNHVVVWQGTNNSGKQVASDVYIYELKTSTRLIRKRMMMLK